MRILNLTSFPAGAVVTARHPPQAEMSFAVRARLEVVPDGVAAPLASDIPELAQGFMTADVHRDDDFAAELVYPSDFADYKPKADLVCVATCHTPDARPMTECPVKFSVGTFSKLLRVVGPRVWVSDASGSTSTPPVAFTTMSLDWTKSFGGVGWPDNPVGAGFEQALPNVESADEPIRSRSDRPRPAGFGPMSPSWATRAAKRGQDFGPSYKARRPYYPVDFDWSFFNAAPSDQQVPYLRGDEELTFQNLHPTRAVLKTKLPGLRIRVFAIDVRDRFREIPMHLDTLVAEVEKNRISLVWRGLDAVLENDLTDVRTALVASEPLASEPRPVAEYQQRLAAYEADPLGLKAALAANGTSADEADRMLARATPKRGGHPEPTATVTEVGPVDPNADPISQLIEAKVGKQGLPFMGALKGVLAKMVEGPRGAANKALLEKLVAERKAPKAPPPMIPSATPEGMAAAKRTALRDAAPSLAKARADAAKTGKVPAAELAKLEALEAEIPKPRSNDAPGPGADLSWRDFSEQDLSGVDLTGANCEGTLFTRAKLRGAKLVNANLTEAVLFEADIAEADFSHANLTLANFASCSGESAKFVGATVRLAYFDQARLPRASFEGATGPETFFTGADLTGAILKKVDILSTSFHEARLEGADFTGAKLVACTLTYCLAAGALFRDATLTNSTFADSDLARAVFVRARASGTIWMRSTLDGTDLRLADLQRAELGESSGPGAKCDGANLRDARFYRASFVGASFADANLMSADLRKADVSRADFSRASLYDAKLVEVVLRGAKFDGANLARALVEEARS